MNASELELEAQISAIARELAADGGRDDQARVFHLGWWSERMLAWAMAHPQFKTQLFRFVDVFPACADDAEVLRHLEEYFDGVPVPGALELGLDLAEHVPLGRVLSATTARRNITRMARQFIAGATPDKAMRRLRRLWENGEASTVDVLGEKTVTEADADRYTAKVEELVAALADATPAWPERPHLNHDRSGPLPMASVSVKPTALSPLFGPLTADEGLNAALERLSPTLERARGGDVTIHVDTEHDDVKDLTFALVRRIAAQVPELHLGCVVQAYRKDSFDDLRDLVAWSRAERRVPLQIRLVKGAYWDYETMVARASEWPSPVFDTKTQTDANFERCTSYLLDHVGEVRPAIGSHNLRSLAYALAAARQRVLDDQAVEFQLLYGMAEPVHAALVRMGLRVRAYVPVGELVPGMAYLIRRLLENTSNESFVRQRFAEGRDLDDLLAPPGIDWSALPEPVEKPPERTVNGAARPAPFVNEPHAELRRPGPRGRVVAAVNDVAENLGFTAPPLSRGVAAR
ncbi:MAG: hypothetical protein E6G60_09660 [Actinobacteria bacterium]|nr:MAG: hypothetical protein E6G60_09660 [Actinomycetota bacterium]